ncbi:esterase [Eremomyces bilateralis CBS 781.70]|uniref:Esterase n=1 Tax=Eremomyces bilateralis CBS 781.70 TaxID=1392243 RepID=A0A6G1GCD5_9PEZI|nr:esterase [Eremomyces bilateralis CBS 781.70]KAF1815560.1 esterase [Eremomyces bilateralis CBS 781.70]
MSTKVLDQILDKYTDPAKCVFNGATFIAVDNKGNTLYKRAAGKLRFDPNENAPLQPDSLCWVASMTKVVTAVAVMQLVERKLLDLDQDVRDIVPELRDLEVLVGFEEPAESQAATRVAEPETPTPLAKPVMEKIKGKLTIRHLVCHMSGFVYDRHPQLLRWSEAVGRQNHMWEGSMRGYTHPLLFQPGTSWGYGPGIDWAGQAIEKVTGLSLEDYMQANIWSKLGAKHTTFHPELRPAGDLPPQQEMGLRPGGPKGTAPLGPGPIIMDYPLKDDLGGIGLFSTAADFVRLLTALVNGGSPLLGEEATQELFRPQLDKATRKDMLMPLGARTRRVLGVEDFQEEKADYCLAGTTTMEDLPGRRKKGSASWAGFPNLHWWVDPISGIAGTLFTQIMPPGDEVTVDFFLEMETALYAMVNERNKKKDGSRL